jgi:hypothetical protein
MRDCGTSFQAVAMGIPVRKNVGAMSLPAHNHDKLRPTLREAIPSPTANMPAVLMAGTGCEIGHR